jgi:Tfp pilus assembly protein PilW
MLIAETVRRRLASESGFTLVELLVSMSLGMIVLFAVLNLLDASGHAGARVTDKSETVQRTRIALDRVTRVLRTQACGDSSTPPIISGSGSSVTFYSDTNSSTTFAPRKITLSYANGSLTQQTWVPTSTSSPWTYNTNPTTTRVLIDNIAPITTPTTPIFAYYSWTDLNNPVNAVPSLSSDLSSTTLADNSIAKIVKIDVAFTATAQSGRVSKAGQTAMTASVFARNADFSGVSDTGRTWGPRCG